MFPVATKAAGECVAHPDVCKVPPAPGTPTPFVNIAKCRDAEGASSRVLACNKEVIVINSLIPNSTGDEAGTLGGVISGIICGPCTFTEASVRVYAEGQNVVLHLDATVQNGINAFGCQETPSQTRVLAK